MVPAIPKADVPHIKANPNAQKDRDAMPKSKKLFVM